MARTTHKLILADSNNLFSIPGGAVDKPVESSPRFPIRTRVLGAARRHLDRFTSLESKVMEGESPKAIHDIRVASRRLQQVLDLLYPTPLPPKVRKLRRAVQRSRKVLSGVRDYDVLLGRAKSVLGRRNAPRREAWESFRSYLEERRQRTFRKAARQLKKLDLATLYVRLGENLGWLGGLGKTFEATGQLGPPSENDPELQLRRNIEMALQETWASLDKRVRKAHEERDAPALHAVRIAAKKTRYIIEVLHVLKTPGSSQAVQTLRRVQRHLGDWHDIEVLEESMLEMVAKSGLLQDHLELAMEVEKVVLQNRKRKNAYEKKFFQMTENSEEWEHLGQWVQNVLQSGWSEPPLRRPRNYSIAFPPSSI